MGISPYASYVSMWFSARIHTSLSTPVSHAQLRIRLSDGAKKIKRLHRCDLHLNSFETKAFDHQLAMKDPWLYGIFAWTYMNSWILW